MQTIARTILNIPSLTPLCSQIEGGRLPALVSGLSPVHRAALAAAIRLETGRPLLVITPDEASSQALKINLEAFLGTDIPEIASREFTLYSADSVSRQSEQKRIAVLSRLAENSAPVVLCTAAGLVQRTMPKEKLLKACFCAELGQKLPLEDAEAALMRCGYIRTSQVEGPGQFSRRGGILDFFSPSFEYPVRMEFWGDEIDSMGFFDIVSQRRIENIRACRALPAAETLPSLSEGGSEALAVKLSELISAYERRPDKKETKKLLEVLREDQDKLSSGSGLAAADRYAALIYPQFSTVFDYLAEDTIVFLDQPGKITERAKEYLHRLSEDTNALIKSGTLCPTLSNFALRWEKAAEVLADFPVIMADAFTVGRYPLEPRRVASITAKQLPSYGGSVEAAADDIKHYLNQNFSVTVLAADERRAEVLRGFLTDRGIEARVVPTPEAIPAQGRCCISIGGLTAGFEYTEIKFALLTETQFIQSGFRKTRRKKAMSDRQRLTSYADLSVGDLLVHEYHGIGRFAGIVSMPVDGADKDYIKICYAGTDVLYVPATQLDLVSKYLGAAEDAPVKLSRMGGTDWSQTKARAKAAAKAMAKELIKLYAERSQTEGHAFAPDSPWQTEFEEAFGYQETDDQLRCIAEIKADMERPVPMERLLCGDVGYGKTEVALRAVMKCVLDGKQAAMLVPTTVLARQHYQTAMQRFFGYPINIRMLSRALTPAQVKQTLQDMKSGACDFVIGTHKLLQKDIEFKNLGLLIVDEEQRFGVAHKEHIREMAKSVDTLTLSATPIPRTLNRALSGICDMSTLEEPPQDRLPVQTFVMEHDWDVLCDAIRRELQRGGQVYYLHNRISDIERCASRLSAMLDGAVVAVAHGKMDEGELSSVMEAMVAGEIQVLVCTVIIETGIDIPNVNTLVIEDADKLGLAQLHQIRGRVGRSSRRASAYLTFRRDKVLTEIAEKRLNAIREFAEFNSGFRIAMRDLEIRGAGNLLGAEQSGHLISVGYDMYIKLLEEAVQEEKGGHPAVRTECSADLAVSANIPERYVQSPEQRMDLYRRIAMIRTEEDADDLTDELIDRFGDPPSGVNALIHVALLRGEASRAGISDISQKAGALRFVLTEFDMSRVSALYARSEFKGRLKVEAGSKPCVSLRLISKRRILDEARDFVAAWASTGDGGAK